MSVLQSVNPQLANQTNRKDLEEDFFPPSYQSMFSSRQDKEATTPTLYGSMKQPQHQSHGPFPPNIPGGMTGLQTGFQGLSLHPSTISRGGMSNNIPFNRSNTAPAGYSSMPTGMTNIGSGVTSFGAPSPPPQRNNMFINNIGQMGGAQGIMGVAKQQSGSRSSLASAINSGLPTNSYGGLGGAGGGGTRMNHMTPFGSTLSDVQGFDPLDFPMLSTRPQQDSIFNRQLVGKSSTETSQEFQMRVEDFPSLPGSGNKSSVDSNNESQTQEPTYSSGSSNQLPTTETRGSLSYDPAPGSNKERSTTSTKQPPRKTVTVPPGMVQDHYGMMGLLTFIKGAETDPNLVALALGSDLTTLGLNLNSPESLYSTFSSPFADSPSRPQDIDYVVPQEYLIHSYIRDKLAPIRLSKYNEDLLFYLYYTSGGDLLQLLAAHELYSRDWRYHKEEKIWITRAPGMRPTKVDTTHEEGTYCYFDVHTWRKCHKDMRVDYDRLSEKTQIPPAFTSQQIVSSVPSVAAATPSVTSIMNA